MKKIKYFIVTICFVCLYANSAEPVTSNCSWKPSDPAIFKRLIEYKESQLCTQSNPDECDELLVSEKGKTYLYSLPNLSCKSDTFIVHRDQVSAVDYFPNSSHNDGNFVRILYSSRQLKKEISGWIELNRLCRLNANGHCPTNNLRPK